LNYLWSPWRMEYINSHKVESCVLCTAPAQADSPSNLVIARGELAYVILNRYPYTSGHLMVVPYDHRSSLEILSALTRMEMIELTSRAIQVLQPLYKPQGFNLGMNIGSVAGAGITEHVHMHIVPRWGGDTNFMTSVAETRVLPEALEDTYLRVKQGWAGLFEPIDPEGSPDL
jgi:ATP adenylyltransferase